MTKKKYAVVFDLDETLGHFSQPYKFWFNLKKFLNDEFLDYKYFFNFLDIFPDFFRTNLFKILKKLKKNKISGKCDYVMIYTNNNGPMYWVNLIKTYIHKKLHYKLFDQIIKAFKIKGQHVEICRTSHNKSYKDFLSCTKLPPTTQICFIDDVEHDEMYHNNVVYIHVHPYKYNVPFNEIATKYYKSNKELFDKYNKTENEFIEFINNNTHKKLPNLYKTPTEKNIDTLISQKIHNDIERFLGNSNNYTRKNKSYKTATRTRKN
tara:strand:+ start:138 stop:929 length:792 start_codon:yes stop_codon:yes gene_type:complete